MKSLKAKQSKSAKPAKSVALSTKPARRTKVLKPEFTPEEVATFEQQLALHKQAENAWQRLTSPPDGDDRWSDVEENLLHRSEGRVHAERRWKYFSK